MQHFLVRLLISTLSLGVATKLVPGMQVDSFGTLLIAAFLMGIVNAVVRPILFILTLPITILTLGLFLLIVNGLSLWLVAALLPGFAITGLGSAVMGWLLVWLTSWLANQLFVDKRNRSR